jgi:hypothetical protein
MKRIDKAKKEVGHMLVGAIVVASIYIIATIYTAVRVYDHIDAKIQKWKTRKPSK